MYRFGELCWTLGGTLCRVVIRLSFSLQRLSTCFFFLLQNPNRLIHIGRRFEKVIAKYSTREAFWIASVYAFRNQRDEAFVWLDRAYAQHEGDVAGTNFEPTLKNLHRDRAIARS
jgi:hypothetical protein